MEYGEFDKVLNRCWAAVWREYGNPNYMTWMEFLENLNQLVDKQRSEARGSGISTGNKNAVFG